MWHAIVGPRLPRNPWTCDWTFDVDVAFKHKGRSRLKSLLLQVRDLGWDAGLWFRSGSRSTVGGCKTRTTLTIGCWNTIEVNK